MNLDHPFHFDAQGRTATTDPSDHMRDLLEQLLLTRSGERVNRPDFGTGALQLLWSPNSPELAAALQFSIQAAVQTWLGDLVDVQRLEVTSSDASLRIDMDYVIRASGERRSDSFPPGQP
jgi:Bacteriophage baseplate protein W